MNYNPSEFDAFGPWIYQVNAIYPLPPLYKGYSNRLDSALIVLKIPRDIERANASPDMHLYDAVLGLYKSELLLLERREDQVCETLLPYDQIKEIKNYTCLLSGRLTLYTENRSVKIPYNTVSENIIRHAVKIIRDNQAHINRFTGISPMDFNLETMAFGFVNEVQTIIDENPGCYLAAYQPEISHKIPKETSNSVLARLMPMERVKSSFAVLTNMHELTIISRTFYLKKCSTDVYSYHYNYISASNITSIETEELSSEHDRLRIGTGNHVSTFRFEKKNKRMYALLNNRWKTDKHYPLYSSIS